MANGKWTALVWALGSCSAVPMDMPKDPACACGPAKAAEVSYDRSKSQLSASTAQDALDELASKSEGKIAPRLQYVEKEFANTGGPIQELGMDCPDKDHDIALSGRCTGVPNSTLRSSGVGLGTSSAFWSCVWAEDASNATQETFKVGVLCLRGAR
jgi:hypothetical protein